MQQQMLVMQQQVQQLLAAQLQVPPQPAEKPLPEGHPPSPTRAPTPLGLRVDTAPRTAALPAWAHSRELITQLARDTCEGQSGIRAENVLAAQAWLEAHPVHPNPVHPNQVHPNQGRRVGPQANPPQPAAALSRPPGLEAYSEWADDEGAEETEEEATEGMWISYADIVAPAEQGGFTGEFSSFPLRVPYAPKNPFPRTEQFRDKTLHYNPSLVGDLLSGGVLSELIKGGYTAGAYEIRSVVPAISYTFDLKEFMGKTILQVLRLRDDGDHQAAATVAAESLIAMLGQTTSIYQHMLERMAVLRKLSKGQQHDLAIYNTMYDNEERATESRGVSEASVDAATAMGRTKCLIQMSARARAQAAVGGGLPPTRTAAQKLAARQAAKERAAPSGGAQHQQQRPAAQPQPQQPRPAAQPASGAAGAKGTGRGNPGKGGGGRGGGGAAAPAAGRGGGGAAAPAAAAE